MKPNRDKFWDIVKGLGIIAVVTGHSGFPIYMVQIIINYYHMAIFFFVSGYLFKDTDSLDVFAYIGKKLKSILWPTIKYIVVFIVLHNLFIYLNIYSTMSDQFMIYPKQINTNAQIFRNVFDAIFTSNYAVEMAGAMWFVYPLIVSMSLFSFLRYTSGFFSLKGNKKELYSFVISMLLGFFGMYLSIKTMKLAWRADIAFLVMPIINAAYLYKLYLSKMRPKWYLAILSLLLLVLCYKLRQETSFAAGIISNPVLFLVATFAGIYVNLFVAELINKTKRFASLIAYIGKNSFHIMALHFLSFKLINLLDVLMNKRALYNIAMFPVSNGTLWPLYIIVGLGLPCLMIYIYGLLRSKFIRTN